MHIHLLKYFLAFPLIRFRNELEQCMSSFSNFIESDQALYYASITHDDDFDQTVVNEVHRAISSRLPGRFYDRSTTEKITFDKLRPKTLYVVITSDITYVKFILNRLRKGTWSTHRKKILIVSDNIKPKDILEYLWSKGFVDVTFLRPSFTIIYQYNHFTKNHVRSKCNSKTIWFPEKMKNLQGHEILVDILNDPPFAVAERNSSGHLVSMSGVESELFNIIAEKLNFQPIFLPRTEVQDSIDFAFLREINSDELLESIYSGKAEMIANARVCPFVTSTELNYSCSETMFYTYTCPLVPIIKTRISANHHFFIAAACIVVVILLDLLLLSFCKFDRDFWNSPAIIRLLLGFPVQAQPMKDWQRIIYSTLMALSMTYLVNVFNNMTNFRLNQFEEVEFTKLSDIFKNHLEPQARHEVIPRDKILWAADEFGAEYTGNIKQWDSRLACAENLIHHKNVTCLMSEVTGNLVFYASTKRYGNPVMKILHDCPWYTRSKIITARGSPYLRSINVIVLWMRASGIADWHLKQTVREFRMKEDLFKFENELILNVDQKIDIKFWVIFTAGSLSIATTVLFIEIMMKRLRRV